ncbi:MAG: nucleotide-binding domain containing protein, partial [Bradyrhizobium sp.]
YVGGRPLEETETWRRHHSCPSGRLDEVLGTTGVVGRKVALATIRGDADTLTCTFASIAAEDGVLAICDAETDSDLRRIAAASLRVSPRSFFIGSAGLAHAVAAIEPQAVIEHRPIATSARGALIVVGSLAENSRAAADALASHGAVHVSVDPQCLLYDANWRAALGQRVANLLNAGADVLVAIAKSVELNLSLGPRLIACLGEALEAATEQMSGFAATGGETAAAILSRCGVNGIRLVDEIEPGVALGFSLGELSVPVATKAGAFGDRLSLVRMVDRLRQIRRKGTFT